MICVWRLLDLSQFEELNKYKNETRQKLRRGYNSAGYLSHLSDAISNLYQ